MKKFKIGKQTLDKNKLDLPYIIAEIGVNHEGDMAKAKKMIENVAEAGGNAVKFQAYKADTLASKYSPSYWDTKKEPTTSQYTLFKKHDSFWESEFGELADYSKSCGIDFMATPFDIESADFLYQLMPAYKIASADITNKPFIEYIAKKNKPIILSTGASNLSEIFQALEWIKSTGNSQISLLHCILNYPTEYANANLGMIKNLSEVFVDNVIGYSDHTNPEHINDILVTSWLLGAQIIEKHYTWNKKLSGNDHYHSMDYQDLKSFVSKLKFLKSCMGSFDKHSIPSEEPARKNARRSLVSKKHIEKGKTIDYEDITWKRPGFGIPPNMIDKVIGGIACVDIPEDTILDFKKVIMKSDSDINP